MSEGGAGGEAGGSEGEVGFEGYGVDAAVAAINAAEPGSISMGLESIAGTAFDPGTGGASADLGTGLSMSQPAQNPTMGLGTGITPGAGASGPMSSPAASDLGVGFGGEATGGTIGGEDRAGQGAPAPDKPKGVSVADEVRADEATRRQRGSQRAAAASVTRNDNDAYLLGYTTPKRKDVRRTLLGP